MASPTINPLHRLSSRPPQPRPDDGDWELDGVRVPKLLIEGTSMVKYSEKKGEKPTVIRLDPDQGQILWPSKKSGIISIENIKELRTGSNARTVLQKLRLPPTQVREYEQRWLTIIYTKEDEYKNLHLLAPTVVLAKLWHVTLLNLHKLRLEFMSGLASSERALAIWEKHHWKGADVTGDNKLDFSEVKKLCRRLNLPGGDSEVAIKFKEIDSTNKGYLDFEDFRVLVRKIKVRPEIEKIYQEIKGHNGQFNFECFKGFIRNVQKSSTSDDEIEQMYRRFATPSTPQVSRSGSPAPPEVAATPDSQHLVPPEMRPRTESLSRKPVQELPPLTLQGFTSFLSSSHNSVFTEHHKDVWQDMNLPISNYWISSSHNTYLVGNQLAGESTAEGYIRALLSSCRSIEMDIYDGDNNEPRITHGGTLTSDVSLRDICAAIAKYAFVASPYPIIISAENHCSMGQQVAMAKIFTESFGDALIIAPLDGHNIEEIKALPSPEQLKRRILLKTKNKYIDAAKPKIEKLPDESDTSDDENDPKKERKSGLRQGAKKLAGKLFGGSSKSRDPSPAPPTVAAKPLPGDSKLAPPTQQEPEQILMAKELLPLLVYTTGCSFRGFTDDTKYHLTHLFSLSESRLNALITAEGRQMDRLVKHNVDHVVRTYPKGTRVDSSNYEPNQFWALGCQLVTVNWQTVDFGYMIMQAMFARNGRAGYLLKPEILRNPPSSPPRIVKRRLVVRVISAQQLPRPKDDQGNEIIDKDTVDPYVRVELDVPIWPLINPSNSGDRVKQETGVVRNNGFNPVWDEYVNFVFDLLPGLEDCVFLRVTVKDKDLDRDGHVGVWCGSLGSIEHGFRHLPLHDEQYGQLLFSTLFVHIALSDA